jgi:BirA family biotin operon repressor/biotin-[acetyl-CoA-carboxylase] ligase
VQAALKWPNDLMVGERKLGGILTEAEPPSFVVVGLGLNVNQTSFDPELTATSIALEQGLRLDRADLAAATLQRFQEALDTPDAALQRFRELCTTIGRAVRVERQAQEPIEGVCERIDDDGAIVVSGARIAAGDVTHLRALPRA